MAPQASITLAFNFSEGHASFTRASSRTYAFGNAGFADAFIWLNQQLVGWNLRRAVQGSSSTFVVRAGTVGSQKVEG